MNCEPQICTDNWKNKHKHAYKDSRHLKTCHVFNTQRPHIHYPRVDWTNKARGKTMTASVLALFYLKVTFPQLHHGRRWTTRSRYSGSYFSAVVRNLRWAKWQCLEPNCFPESLKFSQSRTAAEFKVAAAVRCITSKSFSWDDVSTPFENQYKGGKIFMW